MPPASRRSWIDVQRGIAVLLMIEVHVVHSWGIAASPGRIERILALLGGFAAPTFLFLAGLAGAVADRSLERRGGGAKARVVAGLRRAATVLVAAYLFRLLEHFTGGAWLVAGGWRGLFRVDVLNVIGVALAAVSPLAIVRSGAARAAILAVAASAVALATPWIAGVAAALAASGAPLASGAAAWLSPPPGESFALFPWAAFLLAGAAAGALGGGEDRPVRWALAGLAAFAAGVAADRLGLGPGGDAFWRVSPAWVAMRLGVVMAASGGVQALAAVGADAPWLRLLGRRSLFAYVASVELTYGFWSKPFHGALSTASVVLGAVAMTAVTWTLARALERRTLRRSEGPVAGEASAAPPAA